MVNYLYEEGYITVKRALEVAQPASPDISIGEKEGRLSNFRCSFLFALLKSNCSLSIIL
jgi:hypothetical protein